MNHAEKGRGGKGGGSIKIRPRTKYTDIHTHILTLKAINIKDAILVSDFTTEIAAERRAEGESSSSRDQSKIGTNLYNELHSS